MVWLLRISAELPQLEAARAGLDLLQGHLTPEHRHRVIIAGDRDCASGVIHRAACGGGDNHGGGGDMGVSQERGEVSGQRRSHHWGDQV